MKNSQSKFANKSKANSCGSTGSKNTADATEKDMNLSSEDFEEIEMVDEDK